MNHDYDKIEEKLKQQKKRKKSHKISGRSVFKLQEIIKEKSELEKKEPKSPQNDKE